MLRIILDSLAFMGFVVFWILVCFAIAHLLESLVRFTARSEYHTLERERRERERVEREHQEQIRKLREARSAG